MLRVILSFILFSAFLTGCGAKRAGFVAREKFIREKVYELKVESRPGNGMDVLVDGVKRGETPLVVGVQPNVAVMVEVSGGELWGYKKITSGPPGSRGKVVIKADHIFHRVSYIKGGAFVMGRRDGSFDEKPEHRVLLDGFFIGEHEVTNSQFSQFVRQTWYKTEAGRAGNCWVFQNGLTRKPGVRWKNIPLTGAPGDNPVTCVSWNDANEYAWWLSEKTGRDFRLPTEAEWEYAAGGGARGEGVSATKENLNYCDKNCEASWAGSANDGFTSIAPVKSYPSNSAGLFDMAGNVWEWCEDGYSADYYRYAPERNPDGADSEVFKAVRGGSWLYPFKESEYHNRSYFKNTFRSTDVGFRLVLVPH